MHQLQIEDRSITTAVVWDLLGKYGEGSDLSARTLRAFLYIMAVVCNVLFLFIVIWNTINILGILNIL